MTKKTSQATFFSLPTELRLHIASFVVLQPVNAGFEQRSAEAPHAQYRHWLSPGSTRNPVGLVMAGPHSPEGTYSAASNLSLLLVCRQFRREFTELAWRSTTFFIGLNSSTRAEGAIAGGAPQERLRDLRKIVIYYPQWDSIVQWTHWPFNVECVRLDRLYFVPILDSFSNPFDVGQIVRLLRRLRNVQELKFVSQRDIEGGTKFRQTFNRLVGAIMKEDHYQRYDAVDAPKIGEVWWEWSFDEHEKSFLLVAEKPKPVMAEEVYLQFMKPRIDALMENMMQE